MAYNQFTLMQLEQIFGLQTRRQPGIFREIAPVEVSSHLQQTLANDSDLALLSGTEKSRSEYLIAPILSEIYRQAKNKTTLFSGIQFDVDESRGLAGFCDFLLTLSPQAPEVRAPVISIVEAKKEDMLRGIPQCLAALVAAQIFNRESGCSIDPLYGVITTGTDWQFLRLDGTQATIDSDLYYLDNVEKIVGIILSMLD